MVAFAVIHLRIQKDEFEWLTPNEYRECINVWSESREQRIRHEYELSRFNAWLTLIPNIKNPKSPEEDLMRFTWEPLQTAKILEYGRYDTLSET